MLGLRRVLRPLYNAAVLRPLPGPFARGAGHCWAAPLPALVGNANRYLANNADVCTRSPLVLYEDGVPLGPAHCLPARIRDEGGGRFAHWYESLLFSTSDDSDPNANGRSYAYSLSPRLFQRRAAGRARPAREWDGREPGAFPTEKDWGAVVAAVRLGLRVLAATRDRFPEAAGRMALELGPGCAYGAAMVLACYGLRPLVADHCLAPWEGPYHRWYYGAVADKLACADPAADLTPLRALAEAGGYDNSVLGRYVWPPDGTLPPECADVVYSHSILQHVDDLDGTCRQLARVMRPGGLGLHHFDCRDRRDPARPLEYLLSGEAEFGEWYARCRGECGNRLRPAEVVGRFRQAGLEELGTDVEEMTRLKYTNDLLPRLRGAAASPYRDMHADDLRVLRGWCRVGKATREISVPAGAAGSRAARAGNQGPGSGESLCAGSRA
jgi:SAM-dependent methyltransferase